MIGKPLLPKGPGPIKTIDVTDIVRDAIEAQRREERERPARERKEREDRRTKALAELAALPIEERLARIEAWIYDYRPQYVPPPRFK